MGKWLAGILATIITGLFVWWLTHEGGPLNPKHEVHHSPVPAHVTITEFDFHVIWTQNGRSYDPSGEFKVYNDGEVSADGCSILVGHENPLKSYATRTPEFSVPPKQSSSVSNALYDVIAPGKIGAHLVAQVWCKKGVSAPFEKDVILQQGVNQ